MVILLFVCLTFPRVCVLVDRRKDGWTAENLNSFYNTMLQAGGSNGNGIFTKQRLRSARTSIQTDKKLLLLLIRC